MTGPEHYREAEELLESAIDNANDGNFERAAEIAQLAQVQATLALAAATAATLGTVPAGPWIDATRAEWRKTLSVTLNVTTESDQT